MYAILVSAVELTAQVRARAEVERLAAERDAQRRQLETVLEQSPTAIAITEAPSGRIVFANREFEAILGTTPAGASVQSYSEHYTGFHLDGRPVASAEWPGARALLHGELVNGELLEIQHPSGRRTTISVTAAPVRDAEERIVAGVIVFRDVTNERRVEQQLRDAQRLQAVGTLAGGVAHEVNNQMTGVLGFGALVLKALGPDHPQAEDLQQVLKAGERAARVTQQLLDFSRRQVTRPEPHDLHQVVTEPVPVLRRTLGSDKTLLLVPNRATRRVLMDRMQL